MPELKFITTRNQACSCRLALPTNFPTVDQVGVVERASRFTTRSIKKEAKMQGLKMVLSMIDLTTLEGMDTAGKVKHLVLQGSAFARSNGRLADGRCGLCLSKLCWFGQTGSERQRHQDCVCCDGLPKWQQFAGVKLDDVRMAVEQGADEIDMVISRGRFHAGDTQYVFEEIAAVKEACGKARLESDS